MGGRRKRLILTIGVIAAAILTIGALLFLPLLVAILVGGVAVILLMFVTGGSVRHRRDALSKAQADAAQRGDQAAFMGDRGHGSGWW